MPKVIKTKSEINYGYATIRLTQSRIDKGLIAIPLRLAQGFPKKSGAIEVYLSDSTISQNKHFSSYRSSTRECRIGGMKEWFEQNNIKSGDEIVVQFIDEDRFTYRLIPERNFLVETKELQHNFDTSRNEREASQKMEKLAEWTQYDKKNVALNEYYRLIDSLPLEDGRSIKRDMGRVRESVPVNLRLLLEEIYDGRCQVCDFWFLKEIDKRPYFEIHHLKPDKGHHPRNLVVVCGNCHNQFEYARVRAKYDREWLTRVSFNDKTHAVKQVALEARRDIYLKELFI